MFGVSITPDQRLNTGLGMPLNWTSSDAWWSVGWAHSCRMLPSPGCRGCTIWSLIRRVWMPSWMLSSLVPPCLIPVWREWCTSTTPVTLLLPPLGHPAPHCLWCERRMRDWSAAPRPMRSWCPPALSTRTWSSLQTASLGGLWWPRARHPPGSNASRLPPLPSRLPPSHAASAHQLPCRRCGASEWMGRGTSPRWPWQPAASCSTSLWSSLVGWWW